MNKILTFFCAPVTAIFYPPVYKEAVKSSPVRGVLYCLYLSGLATALLTILFSVTVMPQVNGFVKWAQTSMPALIWTPAGLSLENGKTVADMTHPKLGKIVLFDMTKTQATEADLDGAYALVTSTKVFMKRAEGKIEERDITSTAMRPGQQPPARVRITGEFLGKFYENLKKMMVGVGILTLLVLSFLFFMLGNLFYSLFGLLLNLMRTEKLGYGAIFNLTCFATSVGFTLSWLKVLTPFPFAVSFLVNLGFMFFAFKVTDKKKEAA